VRMLAKPGAFVKQRNRGKKQWRISKKSASEEWKNGKACFLPVIYRRGHSKRAPAAGQRSERSDRAAGASVLCRLYSYHCPRKMILGEAPCAACIIEVESESGAKLRLEWKGLPTFDASEISLRNLL
jgi:hypothetical protein